MTGLIIYSSNNIYTVRCEGKNYLCRIKGKVLETGESEYNPLCVGDNVEFTPTMGNEGLIISRLERRNAFQRWNTKGEANQTIVANVDLVVCVCSVESPPFRPRFIDRVIACSRNIGVLIAVNKCDRGFTEDEEQRIGLYRSLGYEAIEVSATERTGIDELKKRLTGKTVAFVGQSGVGKSTLINALLPAVSAQRTGEVSAKYNKGRHTTVSSIMLFGEEFTLIDTPGVREFNVWHDDPHLVASAFVEFAEPAKKCAYDGCLHDDEPDCEVKRLVEEGKIDPDRYESYLSMLFSMGEKVPFWMRKDERRKEDDKKCSTEQDEISELMR